MTSNEMTNLDKLEHIVYLVRKYENEMSRSKEAYSLAMTVYAQSKSLGIDNLETPSLPISSEDNALNYILRIKGILNDRK